MIEIVLSLTTGFLIGYLLALRFCNSSYEASVNRIEKHYDASVKELSARYTASIEKMKTL